eukprot:scaffold53208_cov37-Cyclotella_meneghiniana.AAC.8
MNESVQNYDYKVCCYSSSTISHYFYDYNPDRFASSHQRQREPQNASPRPNRTRTASKAEQRNESKDDDRQASDDGGQPAAQQEGECISSRTAATGRQQQDGSSRREVSAHRKHGSTWRMREGGGASEVRMGPSMHEEESNSMQGTYAAINQKTIAPAAIAEETAEG